MNTRSLLLAFAVSAAAVTPAMADQARTAKPESAAAAGAAAASTAGEGGAAAAQPRKICRRENATGSRTAGARICMTKDEWRRV